MLHLSNQFSFFLGRQVRARAQHEEEILRFERNQRLKTIASQAGVGEARADARALFLSRYLSILHSETRFFPTTHDIITCEDTETERKDK